MRHRAAIVPVLKNFFAEENIHFIKNPGTLEGGDVMMVGDTFYVGASARTNEEGIAQFKAILESYGFKCKRCLWKRCCTSKPA